MYTDTRIPSVQNRFEKLIQDIINEYDQSFQIDFGDLLDERTKDRLEQRKRNEYKDSIAEMLFQINLLMYEAKQNILTAWLFDEEIESEYYEMINSFIEKHPRFKNAFSNNSRKLKWYEARKESIEKELGDDILPDDVEHFG